MRHPTPLPSQPSPRPPTRRLRPHAQGSGSPAATVVSPGERVPGRKPLAALGANTDAPSPIAKPDGKGGLTLTRTLEAAPVHGSARAPGGGGSF